jgi:ArsR family transcriptional regulator, arsenate/arsenite/antimonite-responsive transcriptional repressor
MELFIATARALGDPARARALVALAEGELCLCQLVHLLGLSPSMVSRHLSILRAAGLVETRKEGRWRFYRLPGRSAPPAVRQGVRWAIESLKGEREIIQDAKAVCGLRKKDLKKLAACYTV